MVSSFVVLAIVKKKGAEVNSRSYILFDNALVGADCPLQCPEKIACPVVRDNPRQHSTTPPQGCHKDSAR